MEFFFQFHCSHHTKVFHEEAFMKSNLINEIRIRAMTNNHINQYNTYKRIKQ